MCAGAFRVYWAAVQDLWREPEATVSHWTEDPYLTSPLPVAQLNGPAMVVYYAYLKRGSDDTFQKSGTLTTCFAPAGRVWCRSVDVRPHFAECHLKTVMDKELRSLDDMVEANRVMCNIADHVKRVAMQLEAKYQQKLETCLADARGTFSMKTLVTDCSESGTGTGAQRDEGGRTQQRASRDSNQARLNGISGMRVIKVRVSRLHCAECVVSA